MTGGPPEPPAGWAFVCYRVGPVAVAPARGVPGGDGVVAVAWWVDAPADACPPGRERLVSVRTAGGWTAWEPAPVGGVWWAAKAPPRRYRGAVGRLGAPEYFADGES